MPLQTINELNKIFLLSEEPSFIVQNQFGVRIQLERVEVGSYT